MQMPEPPPALPAEVVRGLESHTFEPEQVPSAQMSVPVAQVQDSEGCDEYFDSLPDSASEPEVVQQQEAPAVQPAPADLKEASR